MGADWAGASGGWVPAWGGGQLTVAAGWPLRAAGMPRSAVRRGGYRGSVFRSVDLAIHVLSVFLVEFSFQLSDTEVLRVGRRRESTHTRDTLVAGRYAWRYVALAQRGGARARVGRCLLALAGRPAATSYYAVV